MTVYSSGSNTSITITGGQPFASVVVNYTPSGSSLATTITGTTDSNGSFTTNVGAVSSQVTATVGGQQVVSNGNSGCTYNCYNNGSLSLSQSSLSLNSGQSSTITIYNNNGNYYNGSYYISSNSNASVASASISGSAVYVYGNQSGSTTITVCQNSSSCASIYVTVNGSGYCTNGYYGSCNNSLSLSQTNLNLNIGQTSSVYATVYNGGSLFVSSNSNSSAVSASVSGSTINLYGLNTGSSTR